MMRGAVFASAVLAVAIAATSAHAAFPGRNGVIAFVSARDGQESALYTVRPDGSRLRRLTRPPALPASDVAFSPDGRLMAFSRPRNVTQELWLAKPDGSAPRLLVRTGDTESFAPAFSPDGRMIVFTDYDGKTKSYDLWLIGTDGRGRRPLIAAPGDQAFAAWSPDGRRIAYGGDRGVHVLDLRTGKRRLIGPGAGPSWSPDGRRIVSAGRFGVYIMSSTGDRRRTIAKQLPGLRLESPAWSRDGRRIALAGCCDEREGENGPFSVVATMRPDGSDLRQVFVADGAINPAWTRDGRVVFSNGLDLLTTGRLGGRPERYFPQSDTFVSEPAWSPHGGRLALESLNGTRITNARGEGGTLIRGASNPSWSPDRERIAVEDEDTGGVSVVTIATGEFDPVLPDNGADDVSKGQPSWSPDGATIAYTHADQEGFGQLALYDVTTRRSRITAVQIAGDMDWRPDGSAIAYAAPKACSASLCTNIRVYDLRSRRSRLLIQNALAPAWSPDGRWIAFLRRVRDSQRIFVARADGTAVRRLTQGAATESSPAWQPLPR